MFPRSIGVALVAGIAASALERRAYRWGTAFLSLCLPFWAGGLWWSATKQLAQAGLLEGPTGFRQTMLFYTSYWGFWRLRVPDASSFASLVGSNLLEILQAPALLCFPLQSIGLSIYLQWVVVAALDLCILSGLMRLVRSRGWQPAHFILIFYSLVVLAWNYPLANRFLVLFLPVFLLGAAHQGEKIFAAAGKSFRSPAGRMRRFAAAALAGEKGDAYAWIRARSEPADRFISYEDANLYLHTGRQALRPLAFLSRAFYGDTSAALREDVERLGDTARAIGARYWLTSVDDYQLEQGDRLLQEKTAPLLKHSRVVFRSRQGRVAIHQISGR